ncbi:TonB-dependent receptor [Kordiimonas pumila]|uniref:TonB-dependent receptor n=1 Tax=Kordiimonas pumila TaxID=2161677 RepID=A0ABV7D4Z5_9PROT|nr:TonB-dependent receptor [Kordiimonas pumila]
MLYNKRRFAVLAATSSLLALSTAPNISAQEVSPDDKVFQIEEIMVTATRRSESLSDIAMSVSAFDGKFVEKRGLTEVQDLAEFTPSLQIFSEQVNTEIYMIRGIGRANEDISSDSGVAVYINDVYIPRQGAANAAMYDVERVEVLRGPQGTLYGKNAVGGVINIITRQPSNNPQASVQLDFGNQDYQQVMASASGPIAEDKLYFGVSGFSKSKDGSYTNLVDGRTGNNVVSEGLRATLKATPSDTLTLSAVVDFSDANQDGVLKSVIADEPGAQYIFKDFLVVDDFPTQEDDIRSTRVDTFGEQGVRQWGGSFRIDYELSSGSLTSITGYRSEESYNIEDADRTAQRALTQGGDQDSSSFSQELRFVSADDGALSLDGKFHFTGGLYFFRETGQRNHQIYLNARIPSSAVGDSDNPDDGLIGPGSPDWQNSTAYFLQDITTNSFAIFGEATYDLTDALSLTLGGRYTIEKKEFSVDVSSEAEIAGEDDFSLFLPDGAFTAANSKRWSEFTPKATLQYDFSDDTNVYATFSRGFKSGGFNGQIDNPAGLTPFDPEIADNYEVGFKTMLLSNRLQINANVFQVDFNNLQVAGVTAEGLVITSNAANARIRGIEMDFLARPIEGLTLRGGLSLLEAEFVDWTKEEFDPTVIGGPPFVIVDKSGDRLDDTPKYSFFMGADYSWDLSGGSVTLGADFIAKGSTVTNENTYRGSSYQVVNARLDWQPKEDLTFSFWVKNLTDEVYYRGGGPVPDLNKFITRVGLVADPRTFGFTVKKTFGG